MDKNINSIFITVVFFLFSCTTSPTGRKQLNLLPSAQMATMGDESFAKLKKSTPISNDKKFNKLVNCISNKILKSAGENPQEWEIKVFVDKSPNAFALPGKNIGVHTGMIELAKNEDQLAAVIGHEVGHVKADHGNERVSQNMVAQGGLLATSLILGQSSEKDQLILAGLGLGAQYGILLPFSRKHEQEADRLGVEYMANAGFDPRAAAGLWQEMKKLSKNSPPEFLSSHPSHDSRIKDLTEYAKKYKNNYQQAQKSNCP